MWLSLAIVASLALPLCAQTRIKYTVEGQVGFGFNALVATENGKPYPLIGQSDEKCLLMVDQRDFDGNGLTDALVRHGIGCGGNCCSDTFFFVSAFGKGRFEISDEFADSWDEPTIEKWNGKWSVVVVSTNEGMNTDRPREITRRFILERGKAVKVEEQNRPEVQSLLDLRSEQFAGSEDPHGIDYDLDGDGKADKISGRLGERWGRIYWQVDFADGKTFSTDHGCKRIGVLAAKTNGVHDLVCDLDNILRWDGSKYQ